ncbi:MAG: dihydroorotase [Chitinophagaceae bacterium]|nr:MAG: dihydroorotase [Chitinophagaceae bacterium]
MNILLKQVLITDPNSPFNGKIFDMLIESNKISKIGGKLTDKADIIIDEPGMAVSPGWVDVFAHFCDPGYEFKETLQSGAEAAAAGGYTRIFTLPNTKPVTDNKSLVEYAAKQTAHYPVHIHPIGAITQKTEGKELAEMYDMRNSGAIAFSDGLKPVQSPGLFIKALQYVKAFNGVLIQVPIDQSIGASGVMNEGVVSTRLGLPGIPSIAEESILKRDIDLVRYTHSQLHFTGVSTLQSLNLIREAKKEGLQITCSVTPYHLFFCDEDLLTYDTYLKVNPPLRSKADMLALRDGIIDGTIDCIASHHLPQDWDHKICEFDYAEFGMIGLETAFSVVNHLLDNLSNDRIVELFSLNARNIFKLPATHISEGAAAELTLFHRKRNTMLQKTDFKSKSANSAFIDRELNGKVMGIINKGKIITN